MIVRDAQNIQTSIVQEILMQPVQTEPEAVLRTASGDDCAGCAKYTNEKALLY